MPSALCRRWVWIAALALLTPSLLPAPLRAAGTGYDWPQFDGDAAHRGNNTLETGLTLQTVGRLRRVFRVAVPSFVDGAPVYLRAVTTTSGVRDLLFVTTYAGQTLALDAHTGARIWERDETSRQMCPPPFWKHVQAPEPCYTFTSPAIDPGGRVVYSYGLDGYVHRYAVGTGAELTCGNWPALVTRKPQLEKVSSALGIATARSGASYLYVATSSYGDGGDYQGHLTTINLATGTQHVFNALCSDRADVHLDLAPASPTCAQAGAGIWSRPPAVYDPETDRIYVATGNAAFAPNDHAWGESVLALRPDGTGMGGLPLDSYTPATHESMTARDADLGSAAPVILPSIPHSRPGHLAVQGGKDGTLRLLNLDNLSGRGSPGQVGGEIGAVVHTPQGEGVLPQPAQWVNQRGGRVWVFVATRYGLAGFTVGVTGGGVPGMRAMWTAKGGAITSPLVAGGALFTAGSGHVEARDPATGRVVWRDTGIGRIHWASPVVVNGMLYIADESDSLMGYAPAP